jgi:hypothetical protein
MAILQAGNTVIDDSGVGYFNTITVSSNGYIEIPDTTPSVNANTNSFITRKSHSLNLNNAMWSWWTTPKMIRHSGASNNWTYTSYTHANGGVGLAITNHNTGNTVQYTVNSSLTFTADDHNAGAVVAGNNKVVVFMQGRVVNAPANSKNMFYIEFDEGNSPVGKTVVNVTFSTAATATASFYPIPFNANGKFVLLGRQQQANTANQWLAVTGDWPLANLSSPKGLFKSGYTWPYFAFRRSTIDKDVINFAQGWHPKETTSNHTIQYGKILRNGNTGPWDIWSNNSIIGNLTTESGLPFDETDFENVYTTNNFALLLDGTSDYLDLPANTAFALGTGNFTVECFIKTSNLTADSFYRRVFMIDGPTGNASGNFQIAIAPTTGFVNLWENTGALDILGNTNVCDGKWHHIAASRDGTTLRLFVDGYSQNSTTYSTSISPNSGSPRPRIGSYDGSSGDFDGYISNLRVIKGRSLYSANTFGQGYPSSILTNVANTELLTLRSNTIIDASNNNFTITAYGNARMVQNDGPFMPDTLRLYDVHDDAVAFGRFRTDQYVTQYNMAYKSGNTWFIKTVCDGGFPFYGVGLGEYFGGMSISERDKYTVTVSVHKDNNEWEIREYKSTDSGNTWTLMNSIEANAYTTAARPMDEQLSEDAMIYSNSDTLGSAYWMGYFNGSSFNDFNTNIYTARDLGSNVSNTMLDSNGAIFLSKANVALGANITVDDGGLSHGYNSGGLAASVQTDVIDKFTFSADANATDVGDLTQIRRGIAGISSSISGYAAGGQTRPPPTGFPTAVIDRFPFATDINATYVANLYQARYFNAGHQSSTFGYTSGGYSTSPTPAWLNTIDKFPFYSDFAFTSDVGDLTQARFGGSSISSSTHGYHSGGGIPPAPTQSVNTIDKFPFSADANATDVGDLTQARRTGGGSYSTSHGYTAGGFVTSPTPAASAVIDKFPFASDTNATSVGSLTQARRLTAGQSSTVSGYTSGGDTSPSPAVNTIDKFPFAVDASATDVGDLFQARTDAAGHQG